MTTKFIAVRVHGLPEDEEHYVSSYDAKFGCAITAHGDNAHAFDTWDEALEAARSAGSAFEVGAVEVNP